MTNKKITFEDLVENGVGQILKSFGKGEDLRGAVWSICAAATLWQEDSKTKKPGKPPSQKV